VRNANHQVRNEQRARRPDASTTPHCAAVAQDQLEQLSPAERRDAARCRIDRGETIVRNVAFRSRLSFAVSTPGAIVRSDTNLTDCKRRTAHLDATPPVRLAKCIQFARVFPACMARVRPPALHRGQG
jgi:hypothetical protein